MSREINCPYMSKPGSEAPCMRDRCAFWDDDYQRCIKYVRDASITDCLERIVEEINKCQTFTASLKK